MKVTKSANAFGGHVLNVTVRPVVPRVARSGSVSGMKTSAGVRVIVDAELTQDEALGALAAVVVELERRWTADAPGD